MSDTSRIETAELADTDLDNVSAGLSVDGSVEGLKADFAPGPNGLPTLTDGSIDAVSVSVKDIPLGTSAA